MLIHKPKFLRILSPGKGLLFRVSWPLCYSGLSRWRNERGAGFTLLELMIVVAILGTLASIGIPAYTNQIQKARVTRTIAEIRMLQRDIEIYRMDNKTLPDTLDDIGYGNLPDPWGNPYQYADHEKITPGARRKYKGEVPLNLDYDLYSMGPDGETEAPITSKAGSDDIIRADDGNYIGPAWEF